MFITVLILKHQLTLFQPHFSVEGWSCTVWENSKKCFNTSTLFYDLVKPNTIFPVMLFVVQIFLNILLKYLFSKCLSSHSHEPGCAKASPLPVPNLFCLVISRDRTLTISSMDDTLIHLPTVRPNWPSPVLEAVPSPSWLIKVHSPLLMVSLVWYSSNLTRLQWAEVPQVPSVGCISPYKSNRKLYSSRQVTYGKHIYGSNWWLQ